MTANHPHPDPPPEGEGTAPSGAPLLSVRELRTWIDAGDSVVRAVDGVSFDIARGETFALLGESGCGKSLTALSIMRLLPDAGQVVGGSVVFDGIDLTALPETHMRNVRGRRMAMIFQEPMLSLNPVMAVGDQIAEALERHTELDRAALDARVTELLDAVRIPDAKRRRSEYPFQLSGGMKQRVMIAIALACDPELLVADEPTTALDVTIQAQILELLRDLQQARGMSMLLITHDLAVVSQVAHRVAVMYAGQIVETADRDTFFTQPAHPYSKKLFASLPTAAKRGDELAVIRGSVPSLSTVFTGCRFTDRCDRRLDYCGSVVPEWYALEQGQGVRCHLYAPPQRAPFASGDQQPARAPFVLSDQQSERTPFLLNDQQPPRTPFVLSVAGAESKDERREVVPPSTPREPGYAQGERVVPTGRLNSPATSAPPPGTSDQQSAATPFVLSVAEAESKDERPEVVPPSTPRESGYAQGERFVAVPPANPQEPGSALGAHAIARGAALLQVGDLKVHFPIHKGLLKRVAGYVKAVDGVSLDIARGTTLGLVGESGCGKTTIGKAIVRLLDPTSGTVLYDGVDLARLSRRALRPWRKQVQIIFQDPYSSLDPRMRVADTIEEGMAALGVGDATQRQARVDELLTEVGLRPEVKYRYPHEFSGGQRQRIAIARALSVEPQLIVCDEPTSALDVSVQAQILNLLKNLQQRKGLAYLFITHNISVIEFLAHEVAVMYLGRIVERGSVDEVLKAPRHPYTRALLSAVPTIESGSEREIIRLKGDLPSPVNPPAGCHFHPRCPHAMPQCAVDYPGVSRFSATHTTHCHLYPLKE